MKICVDCEFHKRAAVQMGSQASMVDICVHPECRDPVGGSPLPCQAARQQVVFCSIEAKHFVKKEAPPANAEVAKSVIQLA